MSINTSWRQLNKMIILAEGWLESAWHDLSFLVKMFTLFNVRYHIVFKMVAIVTAWKIQRNIITIDFIILAWQCRIEIKEYFFLFDNTRNDVTVTGFSFSYVCSNVEVNCCHTCYCNDLME